MCHSGNFFEIQYKKLILDLIFFLLHPIINLLPILDKRIFMILSRYHNYLYM